MRLEELEPRHRRMIYDAARPARASIARFKAIGVYLTDSLGTDTETTALRDLWLRATLLEDLAVRLAWLISVLKPAGDELTAQTSARPPTSPWRADT